MFGLSHAVLPCHKDTTVEEFGEGLLIDESNENSNRANGDEDEVWYLFPILSQSCFARYPNIQNPISRQRLHFITQQLAVVTSADTFLDINLLQPSKFPLS